NVVWILDGKKGKGLGYLADLSPGSYKGVSHRDNCADEIRLRDTFYASLTSLRLLMFQVNFMLLIFGKKGKSLPLNDRNWTAVDKEISAKTLLNQFSENLGYPSEELPLMLMSEIRNIYSISRWDQFIEKIDLPLVPKEYFCHILKLAILASNRKGYHFTRVSPDFLRAWRKEYEETGILKKRLVNFFSK
ncbi:hypothetical protein HK099_001790, partial [Clydaea vesicula]